MKISSEQAQTNVLNLGKFKVGDLLTIQSLTLKKGDSGSSVTKRFDSDDIKVIKASLRVVLKKTPNPRTSPLWIDCLKGLQNIVTTYQRINEDIAKRLEMVFDKYSRTTSCNGSPRAAGVRQYLINRQIQQHTPLSSQQKEAEEPLSLKDSSKPNNSELQGRIKHIFQRMKAEPLLVKENPLNPALKLEKKGFTALQNELKESFKKQKKLNVSEFEEKLKDQKTETLKFIRERLLKKHFNSNLLKIRQKAALALEERKNEIPDITAWNDEEEIAYKRRTMIKESVKRPLTRSISVFTSFNEIITHDAIASTSDFKKMIANRRSIYGYSSDEEVSYQTKNEST